jgi:hypothetical protein
MAHVSQETKAKLAPTIKAILKKYKLKGSLSVRNHSSLVLNIKSGSIDFIKNFDSVRDQRPEYNGEKLIRTHNIQVNPYWYHEPFTGEALAFLTEMVPAMKGPDFFDHSDMQTDYFHCSHYFDINVGQWNKPYELVS